MIKNDEYVSIHESGEQKGSIDYELYHMAKMREQELENQISLLRALRENEVNSFQEKEGQLVEEARELEKSLRAEFQTQLDVQRKESERRSNELNEQLNLLEHTQKERINEMTSLHLEEKNSLDKQREEEVEDLKAKLAEVEREVEIQRKGLIHKYEQQLKHLEQTHTEENEKHHVEHKEFMERMRKEFESQEEVLMNQLKVTENDYQNRLRELIEKHDRSIEEISLSHSGELETLRSSCAEQVEKVKLEASEFQSASRKKIEELSSKHEKELNELVDSHKLEKERMNLEFSKQMEDVNSQSFAIQQALIAIRQEFQDIQEDHNRKVALLMEDYKEELNRTKLIHSEEKENIRDEHEKAMSDRELRFEEERALVQMKIDLLQQKHQMLTNEFTDRIEEQSAAHLAEMEELQRRCNGQLEKLNKENKEMEVSLKNELILEIEKHQTEKEHQTWIHRQEIEELKTSFGDREHQLKEDLSNLLERESIKMEVLDMVHRVTLSQLEFDKQAEIERVTLESLSYQKEIQTLNTVYQQNLEVLQKKAKERVEENEKRMIESTERYEVQIELNNIIYNVSTMQLENDLQKEIDDHEKEILSLKQEISHLTCTFGNELHDLQRKTEEKQMKSQSEMEELTARHCIRGELLNIIHNLSEKEIRLKLQKELEDSSQEADRIQRDLKDQINDLILKHERDLNEVNETHRSSLEAIQSEYDKKTEEKEQYFRETEARLVMDHREEISTMMNTHKEEKNQMRDDFTKQMEDVTNQSNAIQQVLVNIKQEFVDIQERNERKIALLIEDHNNSMEEITQNHLSEVQKLREDYNEQKRTMENDIQRMIEEHNRIVEKAMNDHIEESDKMKLQFELEIEKEKTLASQIQVELKQQIEKTLEEHNNKLIELSEDHRNEIESIQISHRNEMEKLKEKAEQTEELMKDRLEELTVQYEANINQIQEKSRVEIQKMRAAHESEVERMQQLSFELVEHHNSTLSEIQDRHRTEIADLTTSLETEREVMKTQTSELIDQHNATVSEIQEKNQIEIQNITIAHEIEMESVKKTTSNLIEQHNTTLSEVQHQQAIEIQNLTNFFETEIQRLKTHTAELIENHQVALSETQEQNRNEIQNITSSFEANIQIIKDQVAELVTQHEITMSDTLEQHKEEIGSLQAASEAEIQSMKEDFEEKQRKYEEERTQLIECHHTEKEEQETENKAEKEKMQFQFDQTITHRDAELRQLIQNHDDLVVDLNHKYKVLEENSEQDRLSQEQTIKEWIGKHQTLEDELETCRSELKESCLSVQALTKRDDDNKEEIKKLLGRIEEKEQKILELECTLIECKSMFDSTNKKNEDEITRLNKVIIDLEYVITSKNQDISALVERNQQIREEMAKTDREANVIKSKANVRIKELEEMRTALNIEKQRTMKLEKSKTSIVRNVRERSLNMTAEKDNRYDQLIHELEKKNSELSLKYQTALEDKNDLRRQLRNLQLESTKKKDDLERTTSDQSKVVQKLENERDLAVAKQKEAEEKYKTLYSGYRQLEYNMGLLESKISDRDMIKDKTTSLLESMESNLSTPIYGLSTTSTPRSNLTSSVTRKPPVPLSTPRRVADKSTLSTTRTTRPSAVDESKGAKVSSATKPRVPVFSKPVVKREASASNGLRATGRLSARTNDASKQKSEVSKERPSSRSPIKAPPKPLDSTADLDDTLIIDVESVDIGELLTH